MPNITAPGAGAQDVRANNSPSNSNSLQLGKLTPLHFGAFTLLAASATMNGYSAAGAQTGVVLVAVALATSVVSDAFKAVLPMVARNMARRGEWLSAAACAVLLVLCMTYSGSLALSGALGSRETGAADRQHAADTFASTKAALASAKDALAKVGNQRSVAEVDADIRSGADVAPDAWTRTGHCGDVTLPKSQVACAPFFTLQAERAKAVKAEELTASVKELSGKLAALPAPKPVDALTLAVGRIAGLLSWQVPSQDNVALVAALLVVLVLELGSALGLTIAEAAQEGRGRPEALGATNTAPKAETPAAGEPTRAADGIQTVSTGSVAVSAACELGNGLGGGLNLAGSSPAVGWQADPPAASQPNAATRERPANEPQHGLAALVRVLSEVGGVFSGSQNELAELLGLNRSATRRLVHAAAGQKLVALATVPGHRTTVKLLRQRLQVA